jgi:hypothetical protein
MVESRHSKLYNCKRSSYAPSLGRYLIEFII